MTTPIDRRTCLRGAAPLLLTGLAGCSGSSCGGGRPPTIEGEEPTVAPGEETVVTVSATGVSGLSFGDPYPDDAYLMMEFGNASVSPDTAHGSDGSPPGYGWDGCTDVEVRVPLTVPADTERGGYYYLVYASAPGGDDPPSSEREFTIRVSGS